MPRCLPAAHAQAVASGSEHWSAARKRGLSHSTPSRSTHSNIDRCPPCTSLPIRCLYCPGTVARCPASCRRLLGVATPGSTNRPPCRISTPGVNPEAPGSIQTCSPISWRKEMQRAVRAPRSLVAVVITWESKGRLGGGLVYVIRKVGRPMNLSLNLNFTIKVA